MSKDRKDPLEALRDGQGNFTEIAREIAAGVVKYDRAKKEAPKAVKVPGPERFKELSDQPVRNSELGIPFRTAPKSAAEAAARKEAATPEELGLLPKPKPFTNPGLGPTSDEPDTGADDAPRETRDTRSAPTVVLPMRDHRPALIAALVGGGLVVAVAVGFFVGRAAKNPVPPVASAPSTASPSVGVPPSASIAAPVQTAPLRSSAEPPLTAPRPSATASAPMKPAAPAMSAPTAPTAPTAIVTTPPHGVTAPTPLVPSPAVSSGRLPFIPAPE